MSRELLSRISQSEIPEQDRGYRSGSGGNPENRPRSEGSNQAERPVVIAMARPDDERVDDVISFVIDEYREELAKRDKTAARNFAIQFTDAGLAWYDTLKQKLETNEEEILGTFSQVTEIWVDDEKKKRLTSTEREILQRAAQFHIRRYATGVLHHLTVDDTVQTSTLEHRVQELDRLLGPTFQNSDVRAHYENAKLVVGLWRYGELAAGNPALPPPKHEIPNIELVSGETTLSWADVLYMKDIHWWYTEGYTHKDARPYFRDYDRTKHKEIEAPGYRLVDMMKRLDQSDDNILMLDRRNGSEVTQRDGKWISRSKTQMSVNIEGIQLDRTVDREVEVNPQFVGTAWLVRDKRVAVEMIAPGGKKYYVYRDKLQQGAQRRVGQSRNYDGWYVDTDDLVDVYNRGRTPEEKINPERNKDQELEVLAKRLADGLGEYICLSDAEQKHIFEKERNTTPGLPKTPKEDKAVDWGIRHKGLWRTFQTRGAYVHSDTYRNMPETVFYTRQPLKKDIYPLLKDDGTIVNIELNPDKRGSYRDLVGTNYSTLASMSKKEFIRFARDKRAQYPYLVYERAKSQLALIEDVENRVRSHGRLTIEDIDEMKEKGSLKSYSPLTSEVFALTIRFIRDATVSETRNIQVLPTVQEAAIITNDKIRHGFAQEELMAYKLSAVRVPEGIDFFNISNEQRARLLLNEVWTADEAMISDPVVQYNEWKKLFDKHYNMDKVFLGGVAFERWLKSNKLFKDGGVVDSKGRKRAITTEEFYKWAGVEIYWDKYQATQKKKDSKGRTIKEPITMWRRRLKVVGRAEKPDVPSDHPDYSKQLREYQKWQAYSNDPYHGVDRRVAIALGRWLNAKWPPAIKADWDSQDVFAPLTEEGDLLRDKYKVLDYVMEWVYPNREWRSNAVIRFIQKANRRRPPDELVRPDAEERIKDRNLRGARPYRWGWIPGRQPLKMWQAFTEMSNGTRFEFAPETKTLAHVVVDRQGNERPDGKRMQSSDLVLYRVGAPQYEDPKLERMNISRPGWVTYETLANMPRRYAKSVEAIEYGGGRYIPPKSVGLGIHRRPMELAKHSLQLKIPWSLVEKSLDYQVGVLYQDVVSSMGSAYKKGDPQSEKQAWALTQKRFDEENWSRNIATIVDTFFTYATLRDQGKISEAEYISLLNLSGSWFQFRVEGNVVRPEGLQGGNFVETLAKLGIEDPQLKEFLQRRDEGTKRMIRDVTRLASAYLLPKSFLGFDFLLDKVGEARTSTVSTMVRHARIPLLASTGLGIGAPIVNTIATNQLIPWLHIVAETAMPIGAFLSLAWAGYNVHRIRSEIEVSGKVKNGEYKKSEQRNAQAEYRSIEAQMGGYAVYDYPVDDIIKGAANINSELSKIYPVPWMPKTAV